MQQQPAPIPAGYSSMPNAANPRRRRRNRASATGTSGEITVARCELLTPVKLKANSTDLNGSVDLFPSANVLSWLHKLTVAFERISWLSAVVMYKPFAGTTKTGSVCIGADWNSVAATPTRTQVQAATPVVETPVWQSSQMVLPGSRLMSRREYSLSSTDAYDKQPCKILISVTAETSNADLVLGEIWLQYRVKLSGTTA